MTWRAFGEKSKSIGAFEAMNCIAHPDEALTRLADRYFDPAVRRLSDRLTQVILIGCPHPKIDDKANWLLLDHVLRHDRKMDSKSLKSAAEEAGIVAYLCSKSQEAFVQCPVITTYESQPTTTRYGINPLKTAKRIVSYLSL